jgi:hypothetical protein
MAMGFLDELLNQGDAKPGNKRSEYEQFAKRYDQGKPEDGYDDEEVGRRYNEVARNVDRPTYRKSAHQALSKMQPQQRRQFGQQLQQQAKQHGHDLKYDGKSTDPGVLADLTTQLHDKDPGLLGQLLGAAGGSGAGGGVVSSVLGSVTGGGGSASKGVMAGIVSYATKNLLNK